MTRIAVIAAKRDATGRGQAVPCCCATVASIGRAAAAAEGRVQWRKWKANNILTRLDGRRRRLEAESTTSRTSCVARVHFVPSQRSLVFL
jgi:hypothetical protein